MISNLNYISIVNSRYRIVFLLSPCDSRCVLTIISDSDVEVDDQFLGLEQGDASGDI